MARIVIAGAGALGSIYGGLLAAAGADVVLLARGAHAEAIHSGGLRLEIAGRESVVDVPVAERATGGVVVVTAKCFDTGAVLERVGGAPELAVSFQNGPGKNEALARRFGAETVVGGASNVPAELTAPGCVRSEGLGATFLGELTGGSSERVEALAGALGSAGLETHAVTDIESVEWSKLAQVAAFMAVQAITKRPVHELVLAEDGRALLTGIVTEVVALAVAAGVAVRDRPGLLPVEAIARGDAAGLASLAAFGERLLGAGRTAYRTSMLQAIEAGRRTELEGIHGELVRRAEALGVAAPVLGTCYRLVALGGT